MLLVLILLLVNIPILIKLKGFFYPDPEEFEQAMRFLFTPDLFSLFRGEYMRDRFAEMKLGLMLLVYGVLIFFEYQFLQLLFWWV